MPGRAARSAAWVAENPARFACFPASCLPCGAQERTKLRDPLKAKMRRRVVFGLREVAKALRTKKAKALLLAPNVEAVEEQGGLDDSLHKARSDAVGCDPV